MHTLKDYNNYIETIAKALISNRRICNEICQDWILILKSIHCITKHIAILIILCQQQKQIETNRPLQDEIQGLTTTYTLLLNSCIANIHTDSC